MKLSGNFAMYRFSSWKNGEMEPWYCFIDVHKEYVLHYFTSYYVFMLHLASYPGFQAHLLFPPHAQKEKMNEAMLYLAQTHVFCR